MSGMEVKRYIDNLTFNIRREYGAVNKNMNIYELAKQIGEVRIDPLGNFPEIIKKNNGSIKLTVPASNNKELQKMLIAECIGNLFLHMGFRTDNSHWNQIEKEKSYVFSGTGQRQQAEYFADSLLMPEDLFEEDVEYYANERNEVNMEKVAEEYGVHLTQARRRGYQMNLLIKR